MARAPAFQFFAGDWLRDPALRACTLGARGLWIDIIAYMHQAEPYGHLTVGGMPVTDQVLARMVGADLRQVRRALRELEAAGVFSRTEVGVIYSRRMVRDQDIRTRRAAGGRLGGNPNLTRNPKVGGEVGAKVGAKVNLRANLDPTPAFASASADLQGGSITRRDDPDPRSSQGGAGGSTARAERSPAPAAAARGTRLPDDWRPPDDWLRWALDQRPEWGPEVVCEVAAAFADHWRALPGKDGRRVDWLATWRNWVRRERRPRGNGGRWPPPDQPVHYADAEH